MRPLINPAKLVTLGKRKANRKVQQITAILWDAMTKGQDLVQVANDAVILIGCRWAFQPYTGLLRAFPFQKWTRDTLAVVFDLPDGAAALSF